MTTRIESLVSKLVALIKEHGPDNCTTWKGRTDKDGYPVLSFENKDQRAGRLLMEALHGKIPVGLVVMHECDNPACLNPNHLRLGTPKENTQDALAKGRMTGPRKVSKTVEAQIDELLASGVSKAKIARILELSASSISNYTEGKHAVHGNDIYSPYKEYILEEHRKKVPASKIIKALGIGTRRSLDKAIQRWSTN